MAANGTPRQTETQRTCGACCTRLENFGVTLGDTAILEKIDLHIHCGQLTVVIGPNGGGKTTLLRAMLGEVPHRGTLQFMPAGARWRSGRPRIGYMPQRLTLDATAPTTVGDLFAGATARRPVWLGQSRRVRQTARAALEIVGAAALLDRKLGRLSGGQLQRVLLALALTPLPNLLFLDEPVSGVDQAGIHLFYHMVSDLRRTYDLAILMVSHDLTMAAHVADRMAFLNTTILCAGTPAHVLSDPLVRATFGADFGLPEYAPNPAPGDGAARHAAPEGEAEARP